MTTINPGTRVIIRSADSGAHFGTLAERNGTEVELTDARRLWYWDGAATLSQLATDGTSKPKDCKFPAPVARILVLGVCEVIPATDEAAASLDAVPAWSA